MGVIIPLGDPWPPDWLGLRVRPPVENGPARVVAVAAVRLSPDRCPLVTDKAFLRRSGWFWEEPIEERDGRAAGLCVCDGA